MYKTPNINLVRISQKWKVKSKRENYILKSFNYIFNNCLQKYLVPAPLVVQKVQRRSQWMKFSANIQEPAEVLSEITPGIIFLSLGYSES